MEQTKFDITQKRELFQPSSLCIRETEDGHDEQYIEGDAIMCGVETVLYESDSFREVEVIEPSCITSEFIEAQNMFLNAEHNRAKTFGRQGANLEVFPKADRLSMRCKGTSHDYNEARAKINDGVYTGMSFEFWPKDYTVEERTGADKKTEYVIRHTQFRAIGALTVAMQPAYPTTSIGLREMYREQSGASSAAEEAEKAKREAEEKAAKERELTFARESADRQRRLRLLEMTTNF